TRTVVATIPVGREPTDVVYDAARGEIFVANDQSNTVSVVSDETNTVVATIPVGSEPRRLSYDSGKGEIFVANYGSGISVISDATNTVVRNVRAGGGPGVAYDPVTDFLYNSGEGTISIVSPEAAFDVVFAERGLAAETSWSVVVNGTSRHSSDASITFRRP